MEIILLDRVENLGDIGDKVRVKAGYARNYLMPQGKAATATPENLKKLEARRSELEREAADELAAAKVRAGTIENLSLTVTAKAGSEGKLFGSVGPVDIAEAALARGIEFERSEIRMPDGPIRVAGEHTVDIHLHSDITLPITVIVEGEE